MRLKNLLDNVNPPRLVLLAAIAALLFLLTLYRPLGMPENSLLYLLPAIAVLAVVATYLYRSAGLAIALPVIAVAALTLYIQLPSIPEAAHLLLFALLGYSAAGSAVIAFFMKKEQAKRENLEWLSAVDPLTEVYNHRYFQQRLNEEIARAERNKSPLALVFADLDHFKEYNDQNGHVMGDQALKKTAAFLDEVTRIHDVVCRYGGDEFVIILPECDAANAAVICERLVSSFQLLDLPGRMNSDVNLTLSLGISDYPNYSSDVEELIHQADRALYMAKAAGRNSAQVYRETAGDNSSGKKNGFCYTSCRDNLYNGYIDYLKEQDRPPAGAVVLAEKDGSGTGKGNGRGNGNGNGNGNGGDSARAVKIDKNLYIGRAIGAGHAKIDPVRLSTCLSELNLH